MKFEESLEGVLNKMKHIMVNANEVLDLDPLLWQELPQDLLKRVLMKLPFSRLVAFRTVCKHWLSNVIPSAAPNVQASNRATLLYINTHHPFQDMPKGRPSWVQLGNTESGWAGSVREFEQNPFPPQSNEEEFQLMICEQGLLFFGLVVQQTNSVKDFFVWNPLTSQAKSLGLPRPLTHPCDFESSENAVLVGTVFDSKNGSYLLVVAGVHETRNFVTYLYDSLTSAWTTGSSLLPAILEFGLGFLNLSTGSSRSVYSNGSLYWYAEATNFMGGVDVMHLVVKFDIQLGSWRLIRDLNLQCEYNLFGARQMALYKGEIMLWHLHRCLFRDYNDDHDHDHDNIRYWPCRAHREIESTPEIKFMQRGMIEKLDRLLGVQSHPPSDRYKYFAFGQQNFLYHVMEYSTFVTDGARDIWVKIVLQETNENSFTELATVYVPRFPSRYFYASDVWSFVPSLTSLP